jgi:hypothetical protein
MMPLSNQTLENRVEQWEHLLRNEQLLTDTYQRISNLPKMKFRFTYNGKH